ncbi:aminoglycoside phosphotransferase family protein [Tropicimonas isoalkanivorans]|uniref:Aminoglycoside phosphotransferase domain-containing protein n=1 Tax=Tropicimonas isoalkanivorans TaxID=441112 RepID=A0A1I1M8A6_9RHOB|nr:phosphotransferase [Tropicimonas isoalkanivorans]SFC81574.1 hypothetical protein SAMN04488094_109199 [Tropicimonas isoalkanivorans]
MTRQAARDAFLRRAGWGGAEAAPLAGDASTRRYERLARGAETAILMDAPPDRGNDVEPFVRIAGHLTSFGLSAPRVLAEDRAEGFLLLEDLGDALLARLVAETPADETALYAAATDLLVALHRHPAPPDLPRPGPKDMAQAVDLALTWYAPGCGRETSAAEVERCVALVAQALADLPVEAPVVALRDFHAENLIWLPERSGPAKVGLLDFQDAFAGRRAYDLVSLLEDARRDVPPPVRAAMIDRYIAASGCDADAFRLSADVVAAQRNLRILGVFARLAMHFGKPKYVDLIPRVWAHLQGDLAHPALAELAAFLADTLPDPTPDRLERIRHACGTHPTP